MAFWMCPACGRKVPGYAAACHCGVAREAASQVPPEPAHVLGSGPVRFKAADVPRPAWVALVILVIALLVGLWRLFQPAEPNTIPPLLGQRELTAQRELPSPASSTLATPSPPEPRPSQPRLRVRRRAPAATPTP